MFLSAHRKRGLATWTIVCILVDCPACIAAPASSGEQPLYWSLDASPCSSYGKFDLVTAECGGYSFAGRLKDSSSGHYRAALVENGKKLVVTEISSGIRVFQSEDDNPNSQNLTINGFFWFSDSRTLVYYNSKEVFISDVETGKRNKVSGLGQNILAAACDPKGQHLAVVEGSKSAQSPSSLKVINLSSNMVEFQSFIGRRTNRMGFSPDGRYLVVNHFPGGVNLYNASRSWGKNEIRTTGIAATCFAFSPDSKFIAITDMSGLVAVFETSNGELLAQTTVSHPTDVSWNGSGTEIMCRFEFQPDQYSTLRFGRKGPNGSFELSAAK